MNLKKINQVLKKILARIFGANTVAIEQFTTMNEKVADGSD